MAAESYNDDIIELIYNELEERDNVNMTLSLSEFKEKYIENSEGREKLYGNIRALGILGMDDYEDTQLDNFLLNKANEVIDTETEEEVSEEQPKEEQKNEVAVTEEGEEIPLTNNLPQEEKPITKQEQLMIDALAEKDKIVPKESTQELKDELGVDYKSDYGLYGTAGNVSDWAANMYSKPADMPTGGDGVSLEKKPEDSDAQKAFDALPQSVFQAKPSKAYLKSLQEEEEAKKKEAEEKKNITENLPKILDDEIDVLSTKLINLKQKNVKSKFKDKQEEKDFNSFLNTNPAMQEYIGEMKQREGDENYDITKEGYDWLGMYRTGEVPRKTGKLDAFGRETWELPQTGTMGQSLYPLSIDKEYYHKEWDRLSPNLPLTEAYILDKVKDEDKEDYLEAMVKKLQIAESLINADLQDPNATAGDLIKSNLNLTKEQVEYNETVQALSDAYTARLYADQKWFRDYTAHFGKTPVEANVSMEDAKRQLRFSHEEYVPLPSDFAEQRAWMKIYKTLTEDEKERIRLKQIIDYNKKAEEEFVKEYKEIIGEDIEAEWEQYKKDTKALGGAEDNWWNRLTLGEDEIARRNLFLKTDSDEDLKLYKKEFYDFGRYEMNMRLRTMGRVIQLSEKAKEDAAVREGIINDKAGNTLGYSDESWLLMDYDDLEENIVPKLKKMDKTTSTHTIFLEAAQKTQNDILNNVTYQYTSDAKLNKEAEINGINMYDPSNAEAVSNMKTYVASQQVAYGMEHLSPYQQAIAKKVEKYGEYQKKQVTGKITTDEILEMQKLKAEINSLRDNPEDLYNPTTGEWVSMKNKDFKSNDAALVYEREVNELAHTARQKNNTDALINLWDKSAAQLQYWENTLDGKKYQVQLTITDRSNAGMYDGMGGGLSFRKVVKNMTLEDIRKNDILGSTMKMKDKNGAWTAEVPSSLRAKSHAAKDRLRESRRLFDVYNRALFLNEDPAGIKTWTGSNVREGVGGFINEFAEKAGEGFIGEIDTDADFAVILLNGLKSEGVEISSIQQEIIEEDLSTMTASSLGSTVQPMVAIVASSIMLNPAFGVASIAMNSARAMRVMRVVMLRKWGRTGKFMYHTMKGGLKGSLTFGAAPSDMLSWQMGAGEGAVQGVMDNMNVGKKLFGKWGKILTPITKVVGGATAETFAEYAGEYCDQLSKTGFDWNTSFERTFGATKDEALKKLYTTAIVSLSFSSAFNLANAKRAKSAIENSPSAKTEIGKQALSDIDEQIKAAEQEQQVDEEGLNNTEKKAITVLNDNLNKKQKQLEEQEAILSPDNPMKDEMPSGVREQAVKKKNELEGEINEINAKKEKILDKVKSKKEVEVETETTEEVKPEETKDETTEVQDKQDDVEVSLEGEPTVGESTKVNEKTKTKLDNFLNEKKSKPKDRTRLTDSKSFRTEQKSVQREVAQIITGKGSQEKISKQEADVLSDKLGVEFVRNKDGGASMTEVINKTVGKADSKITTEQFLQAATETNAEVTQNRQQQESIDQEERIRQFKENANTSKRLQEEANKAEKLAREGKIDEAKEIISKVKQESSTLPSDVGGLSSINTKINTVENLVSPAVETTVETTTDQKIEDEIEPTDKQIEEAQTKETKEQTEVEKSTLSSKVNSFLNKAFEGKKKNAKNQSIKAWWGNLKKGLNTTNEASALKAWREAKAKLNEIVDINEDLTQDQKNLRNELAKEMNSLLGKSNFDLKVDMVENTSGSLEGTTTRETVLKLKPEEAQKKAEYQQNQKLKDRGRKGDIKINKKKAPEGVKIGDEIEIDGEQILVTNIVKQGRGEAVVGVKPVAYKGSNTIGQDIAKGRKARVKGFENTTNNYLRQSDGSYADINGNPPPANATPIYDVNMTPEQSQDLKNFREADSKNRNKVDTSFYNRTYKPKAKQETTTEPAKPKTRKVVKPTKKTNTEKKVKTEKQIESESKTLSGDSAFSVGLRNQIDNDISPNVQIEIANALGLKLNADLTLSQAMEKAGMFKTEAEAKKAMEKVNEILNKDAESTSQMIEEVEETKKEVTEETKKAEKKVNDDVSKLKEKRDKEVKKITPEQKKRAGVLAKILSDSNHPWAESFDGDFNAAVDGMLDMMNKVMDGKISWDEYIQEYKSRFSRTGANANAILDTKADKTSQEAAKELMNLLAIGNVSINKAKKINEEISNKTENLIGGKGMIDKGTQMMQEALAESQSSLNMAVFGSPSAFKFMGGLVMWTAGQVRVQAAAGFNFIKSIPKSTLDILNEYGWKPLKKFNPAGLFAPIVLGAKGYSFVVDKIIGGAIARGWELMGKLLGKIAWNPATKGLGKLLGKAYVGIINSTTKTKAADGEMEYTVEGSKSYNEALELAAQGKTSKAILETLKFYAKYYNNAADWGLSTYAKDAKSIARSLNTLINQIEALDVKNYRQVRKIVTDQTNNANSLYEQSLKEQSKPISKLSDRIKNKARDILFNFSGTLANWKIESDYIADSMKKKLNKNERVAVTMILEGQKEIHENAPLKKSDIAKINKMLSDYYSGKKSPLTEYMDSKDGKRLKDFYKTALEAMIAEGKLGDSYIAENYVPHLYKIKSRKKGGEEQAASLLKTKHSKKRVIPTYNEAISQGYQPMSLDASDIVSIYSKNVSTSIGVQNVMEQLGQLTDGAGNKLVTTNKAMAERNGYYKIRNKKFAQRIFGGFRTDGSVITEEMVGDKITDNLDIQTKQGDVYVHPDLLKKGRFTGETGIVAGLMGNTEALMDKYAALNVIEKWNNMMKRSSLSFSFFHHLALTETLMATGGAFSKGIQKGGNPIVMFTELMSNFTDKKGMGVNVDAKVIYSNMLKFQDAIANGLKVEAAPDAARELNDKTVNEIIKTLEKGGILGKALALPAKGYEGFAKSMDSFLWDYMHNNYKLIAYETLLDKGLNMLQKKVDSGQMTEEQMAKEIKNIKRVVASQVNDTFGGQNWVNLNVAPSTLRYFQMMFLSPDWTVSTVRQALSPIAGYTSSKIFRAAKIAAEKSGSPSAKMMLDALAFFDVNKNMKSETANEFKRNMGIKFWVNAGMKYYMFMNIINLISTALDDEDEDDVTEFGKETVGGAINNIVDTFGDRTVTFNIGGKDFDVEIDFRKGKWMWENDLGRRGKLFFGRRQDGRKRYLSLGKQFNELPELIFNFGEKAGSKLSPIVQLGSQTVFGQTAGGFETFDKEETGIISRFSQAAALGLLPFTVQSNLRGQLSANYADYSEGQDFWIRPFYNVSKGMSSTEYRKESRKAMKANDHELLTRLFMEAHDNRLPVDYQSMFDDIIKAHQEDFMERENPDPKIKLFEDAFVASDEFKDKYLKELIETKIDFIVDVIEESISGNDDPSGWKAHGGMDRFIKDLMKGSKGRYPQSKAQRDQFKVDIGNYVLKTIQGK